MLLWHSVLIFFNSKNLCDVPVHLHVSATLDSIAQQKRKKSWPTTWVDAIPPVIYHQNWIANSLFPRHWHTWLVSSGFSPYLMGRRCLFSVGWPSFWWWRHNKIPYRGEVLLHRSTLPPIFSTGLVQTDS